VQRHVQHITELQSGANNTAAPYQRITAEYRQIQELTMKLTINSSELTKALEQAAKFVSVKPLMPILGNLKLVATEERLEITGFNLAHGIQIECVTEVVIDGSVCIPASSIAIVKGMSGQLIFESDENDLITISNLSGNIEIQGQSTEDYPQLIGDDFNPKLSHQIDSKSLSQAVKYCSQATSIDETKAVLTGINITAGSGNMRLMATDGHRLVVCNILCDEGIDIKSATIPAKSLSLATDIKVDGAIKLSIDTHQALVDYGDMSIMRILDGKYPDAMMLIPKSFSRELEIDRKQLIDALNMMAAISDQKNVVKFQIGGKQTTVSSSSDGKKGKVDIASKLSGESLDLAFNLKYLIDGLKMFDTKQVNLSMNDPLSPVIITSVGSEFDLTYLVMPIQLRD
jgi:DNA polymerase III subunit beta